MCFLSELSPLNHRATLAAKMASKFRQEMPPQGGFPDIDYKQKLIKPKFRGIHWALLGLGSLAAGTYLLIKMIHGNKWLHRELTDARIAVEPFYRAEYDRELLKQLRRNRDEENELMKNVEGWETGTYYGKPVYSDKEWHAPSYYEFYAHNNIEKLINYHQLHMANPYTKSVVDK